MNQQPPQMHPQQGQDPRAIVAQIDMQLAQLIPLVELKRLSRNARYTKMTADYAAIETELAMIDFDIQNTEVQIAGLRAAKERFASPILRA